MALTVAELEAGVSKLADRVNHLEAGHNKNDGAIAMIKWIAGIVAIVAPAIIVFFGNLAWSTAAKVEAQAVEIAALKASLKETAARLQAWEDKGFRAPVPVGAFFHDAELVSFKGDKLTVIIDSEGKKITRTFTVNPEITVETRVGKRVPLKTLDLQPGAALRVMLGEDPGHLLAVELGLKKK